MDFLEVGFGVLLHVFGQAVLDSLLQFFDAVAACVANGHLGFLAFLITLLGEVAATLFGEGRDAQADDFAVVFRHDSYVGIDDGLFDMVEHRLIPGFDGNGTRIGRSDCGHIVDGHHRTVGIHADFVEDMHIGLASTDMREGFLQVHHTHFHLFLASSEQFFYVNHDWLYLLL